jgi:hypothetical protein
LVERGHGCEFRFWQTKHRKLSRWLLEESVPVEPLGASADSIKIKSCDASAQENFVDGIEESPRAVLGNGDIAIEFASGRESAVFSERNWIFEPIPVVGLVGVEDESGLAVGVLAIPVGVTKGLVNAMCVERAHEGLNGHSGWWGIGWRVRPRGEPAAVVKLTQNCEVRDDAWPEIAAGTGNDFGNDGVVDVNVEGGLTIHGSVLRDEFVKRMAKRLVQPNRFASTLPESYDEPCHLCWTVLD